MDSPAWMLNIWLSDWVTLWWYIREWLIFWVFCCLIGRLIDWLIDWLIVQGTVNHSVDRLIDWLIDWFTACVFRSAQFSDWIIKSLIHPSIDWLIDWLIERIHAIQNSTHMRLRIPARKGLIHVEFSEGRMKVLLEEIEALFVINVKFCKKPTRI